MREIKFRAWDKIENRFINFISISFKDNWVFLEEEYNNGKPVRELSFHCDDITIMQFTGLHDKNGVEIYEGDVIKVFGDIASVFYYKECCAFYYQELNGHIQQLGDFSSTAYEVIGNIYEHPHLLEVKE